MKRLVVALACISVLGWRVVAGQTEPLPAGTRVRLTIPTIDYPEYRDNATIVRRGRWEVWIRGYTDFIPGEMLVIEGVVGENGRVKEGRVGDFARRELRGVDYALVQVARVRRWAVTRLQQVLPEPQASLAIGILLGVKREMPREFYDQLVATGTLHIVAASGYNVSVVASTILAGLSMGIPRAWALAGAVGGVGLYVLLAGGSAPIVRAGIMGSLSLVGLGLGKVSEAKRLLGISCGAMLMVKPDLVKDVGFQLSVAATLGMLYLTPIFERAGGSKYLKAYLYPTLAATLATSPVIYGHFGRVSLIGVLVNMLILPVVPGIMLLAAFALVVPGAAYLLYLPLWWVVEVVGWF